MRNILCVWSVLLAALGAWAADGTNASATHIAFLSDIHLTLSTNEPGLAYDRHFDRAIAEVNAAAVDLVLIAGDLTDRGTRPQMERFKQKAKQFKAPLLYIPGNHDVGVVGNGGVKTSITPERVKLYGRTLGPNWFVQEKAGVRVIGINACLFGSGFKEEADQWKFLDRELAKPQAKPALLLTHYPLFLLSAEEPRLSTWNTEPEARQRLLTLIERAGVRAVLSGHLHYPIGNRRNGTLLLGNGTTAYGMPRGRQPEGWMLLTVPREGEM